MVGSEAAVPRNWSGAKLGPVGVCLGPSSGMLSAGLRAPQGALGLSLPMANFRKVFLIQRGQGEGALLGVVSACALVSKAGSGCVWEAGL